MYSIYEASMILSKSATTISKWIRKGIFPNAYKEHTGPGKHQTWFIPKDDIERKKEELEKERSMFTVNDIAKKLGVDPNSIRRAIKNGKLPNAIKYETTEFGPKNVWMIPEEDVIYLKNENEAKKAMLINNEKYYCVLDVIKLIENNFKDIGSARQYFYKGLKNGMFPNAIKADLLSINREEWLIPECDIKRFKEISEKDEDFCLSLKDISEKWGLKNYTILKSIHDGRIKEARLIKGKWLISKTWFESNVKKIYPELFNKYYTIKDVVDIVGKCLTMIRIEVPNIFPNAKFDKSKNSYLIPEDDVINYQNEKNLLEEKYFSIKDAEKIININRDIINSCRKLDFFSEVKKKGNTYFFLKEEIYKLQEEIKNPKGESIILRLRKARTKSDILSTSDISKIINKSSTSVRQLIKKGEILAIGVNGDKYLVTKDSLNKYLEKEQIINNDYITVHYIAKDLGIKDGTVTKWFRKGIFPGAIMWHNAIRIPVEEYKRFKNRPQEPKECIEKFKYKAQILLSNNSHLKNTIQLYTSFFIKKFSDSQTNNPSAFLSNYYNALNGLVDIIHKDMYLYSDIEIDNLIVSKKIIKSYWNRLTLFLNYLRVYEADRCRFKKVHSYKQKQKKDRNKNDEIYSKKAFMEYYNYAKDVEIHLKSSIMSRIYTCTWLFIILHFIDVWRRADINNVPNINIEVIDVYHVEWFEINRLNKAKALKIITQLKDMFEILVVGKTDSRNMFTVHADMLIPVATVLVLAEIHRRKDGKSMLMECFKKSSPSRRQYIKFFADNPDLVPKSFNRKANKSMLTYIFYSVLEGDLNGDIALAIAKRLRAHSELSSTEIYLMTENQDGPLDDASFQLLRRGPMGWLYCVLIDILLESKGIELTMEQKTRMIEKYEKMFKPSELERISDYFINRQNLKYSVAMEMICLPPTIIRQKIENIFNGLMSSRLDGIPCFYSSKNCPNKKAECFGCPYIFPNIYMMVAIKTELEVVLNKIDVLYEHRITERIRETNKLFCLMDLLRQIGVEYGKNFINEFIDTNALLDKLCLINAKLLQFDNEGQV